jgi:hypothetical protein
MDMVGHDHEFVQLKDSSVAISKQHVQKKLGGAIAAEEGLPLCGYCRDEEDAFGKVHATAAKAASPF